MNAIIYSRVSSTSQSTKRQINELRAVEGFTIMKVFNESVSGYTKSAQERPQLINAIDYAKNNDIDVLMVHEVSRLGRRTREVLTIIDELKKSGIKLFVKTLNRIIDTNSSEGSFDQLIITLMTDMARMEAEQMSFRIKSGLLERKRQGYAIGRQYGSIESTERFLIKHKKIVKYLEKGESVRWIAAATNSSPTTVQKVRNTLALSKNHVSQYT